MRPLPASFRLTVLVEDTAGYNSALLAQHGLAVLVETPRGARVLFDCGQEAFPLLYNMRLLGIRPESIDLIALSHCHYDHTGGLLGVLRAIRHPVPVVAHPLILRPNLIVSPHLQHVGVPFGRRELEEAGARFMLLREPSEIADGVIFSGEIPRDPEFEGRPVTYTIEGGRLVEDRMLDDAALILKLDDREIAVVTGCAHAGVVNVVRHALRITKAERVRALIGGLHLIDEPPDKVGRVVRELESCVDEVYVGHCTGFEPCIELRERFRERFHLIHAGTVIELGPRG